MRGKIRASTVTLKHIQTQRRNGRVYRYLRVPGRKAVRLPDLPMDHPVFLAAYTAAYGPPEPARSRPKAGTITAMIDAYLQSERHLALSPDYRRIILRHALAIQEQAEDALARDLESAHIRDDLRPLSPHAASSRLKAWRLVCAFGVENGLLAADPSDGVKRKPVPKTGGHPPWSPDDVEAFRAHWPIGTVERAAMEVFHWTAARVGDCYRLTHGMVGRDGILAFKQAKTGGEAYVPWTCPLPAYAAHTQPDRDTMHEAINALPRHMTILVNTKGRPWSKQSLGNLIGIAARAAGLQGRSAHGLRKSRCIALAEGGATQHQGQAWSGHLTADEWQHYIEAANRRRAVRGLPVEFSEPESVQTGDV